MEHDKKFAFLFAAMAVIVLVIITPTALANRNEVLPINADLKAKEYVNAANSIRNPFANVADSCVPSGDPCGIGYRFCGNCWCYFQLKGLSVRCLGDC